jgi:hypothetical protein
MGNKILGFCTVKNLFPLLSVQLLLSIVPHCGGWGETVATLPPRMELRLSQPPSCLELESGFASWVLG